jgi:hypothetical protein
MFHGRARTAAREHEAFAPFRTQFVQLPAQLLAQSDAEP